MFVIKRDGRKENVMFDKITSRIAKLCYNLNTDYIYPSLIAQQVINFLYPGITTIELDNLAAQKSASMIINHPDHGILAGRISISNLHKETKSLFSDVITDLYNNKHPDLPIEASIIPKHIYDIVMKNVDLLNNTIKHMNDFNFDYFGFKTLEKSYLHRINNIIVERPQYMFMRVAIGIHESNIDDAIETYILLSEKWFIHATPTLFNAGTTNGQMSSCYLLTMSSDSIDGIFETLHRCAIISKSTGGIGLSISCIRSNGSYIKGTNGYSDGIIPMIRIFNNVARYVNQGGKRPGAYSLYIEPWHADIFEFLDIRKNTGIEENRARDIFTALWIPDLFMQRVKANDKWTLMCPNKCKNLQNVWGQEFNILYTQYEKNNLGNKTINAQELWIAIINSQIETGTPFMLYKDHCNSKSNQKHLGTIHCSNLCVAPETRILTDTGYHNIKSLANQRVKVWNGIEFSETVILQTGNMQKLITVHFSNSMSVRCTPYHNFYINKGDIIQAKDLKPNMSIIKYNLPTIDTHIELKHPYIQGKFSILGIIDKKYEDMKDKYFVPINYSINSKLKWFAGVCDACAIIVTRAKCKNIHIRYKNKEFLSEILLMLQTMGISALNKSSYRLIVTANSVLHLISLGFKSNRLKLDKITKINSIRNRYIKVVNIEDKNEYSDTYCFTEPIQHKGIFNGILMGQCTEIIEYTAPDEVAVCNLASIALPKFVNDNNFNFTKLVDITSIIVKNLNKIIDLNFYPLYEAKKSNLRHRPIGIGVQGLADMFCLMRIPFESMKAQQLNKDIFETIYYAALRTSCDLAKLYGHHESHINSPISKGIFQFDMWNIKPSDRWDWLQLKDDIFKYGVRNSLLIAPMPTASTAQILGNNESIEPYTSNLYIRRVLSGEFQVVNSHLLKDLICLNLWNAETKNQLMQDNGSIQNIKNIPDCIKALYKTVWEISQKTIINMAVDRGAFIDQSQSLNIHIAEPTINKISSIHFYTWEKGLKTGMYYLRTRPAIDPIKFTVTKNIECTSCSA